MKPIKRLEKGQFVAVYAKKSQCDFNGTMRGGRSIVFEAKHTGAVKILQSAVTPEQTEWLQRHHNLGALCFVMVSFAGRRYFRVPWINWVSMKEQYGHKYLTLQEMETAGIELPITYTAQGEVVLFLD